MKWSEKQGSAAVERREWPDRADRQLIQPSPSMLTSINIDRAVKKPVG